MLTSEMGSMLCYVEDILKVYSPTSMATSGFLSPGFTYATHCILERPGFWGQQYLRSSSLLDLKQVGSVIKAMAKEVFQQMEVGASQFWELKRKDKGSRDEDELLHWHHLVQF